MSRRNSTSTSVVAVCREETEDSCEYMSERQSNTRSCSRGQQFSCPRSNNLNILTLCKGKHLSFFVAEANLSHERDDGAWIFDTAASSHFCKIKNLFSDYKNVEDENMILAVNGVELPIEGKGNKKLSFGT
ncbi:hypothetical protein TNCV_4042561 [Trichonephila clavipes]|nr:hypothetical protein TNCV_4042561 [Trichonephila clavipes]